MYNALMLVRRSEVHMHSALLLREIVVSHDFMGRRPMMHLKGHYASFSSVPNHRVGLNFWLILWCVPAVAEAGD